MPEPTPVFILGITQRSGTNFLYRALLEHPDCAPARQPGEDYLVHGAEHLARYVDTVSARWNLDWDPDGARRADLSRALGRAWLRHLRPDCDSAAFVTKTPSVRGIAHVHRFLPEARVLALVRDGRDVAESAVRSFGLTYSEAFRRWHEGAVELLSLLDRDLGAGVSLFRFEDLCGDAAGEFGRVLAACELDASRYDFEAVAGLPVFGSSTARGGAEEVHWDPVPKPDGFDPVGQWSAWDATLLARYDRTCGALAERLGYSREPASGGGLHRAAEWLSAWRDRR